MNKLRPKAWKNVSQIGFQGWKNALAVEENIFGKYVICSNKILIFESTYLPIL